MNEPDQQGPTVEAEHGPEELIPGYGGHNVPPGFPGRVNGKGELLALPALDFQG